MKKQICILTKSYKNGGYCVAGIDMNTNEWIRVVTSNNPETDEIREEQIQSINCLDVIEYDFIKSVPNFCQVENWLLNTSIKPKFIKTLTIEEVVKLIKIEKENYFICNKESALSFDEIVNINRSLFIFNVKDLKIEVKAYDPLAEIKFKYKCSFKYNDTKYNNISLTDPEYRDISKNGVNYSNALIIVSLPSIPFIRDYKYYKFVAKIIPIDEQITLSFDNIRENNKITSVENKSTSVSPFIKFDLVVHAQQTPGDVSFDNYEQLKQNITDSIVYYSGFEYTLDKYQVALKHHTELKHVKNILQKAKREIVKNYNTPLELVEKKLDELINLVKRPFIKVDTFIKQNQKNAKEYEIYLFAKDLATAYGLQEHMENIFKSPAFFETKWLNVSCSKSFWENAVTIKIINAVRDIKQILSMSGVNVASILAHYYQTLSISKVEEFMDSLKIASNIAEKTCEINIRGQNSVDIPIPEIRTTNNDIETVNSELNDYKILDCVANSINPYTGEVISGIDNCLKLKLQDISIKLEMLFKHDIDSNATNSENNKKIRYYEDFSMAWKRWTEQEDARLIEEFKRGLAIEQIAEIHNRKTSGIRARLKKHHLIV